MFLGLLVLAVFAERGCQAQEIRIPGYRVLKDSTSTGRAIPRSAAPNQARLAWDQIGCDDIAGRWPANAGGKITYSFSTSRTLHDVTVELCYARHQPKPYSLIMELDGQKIPPVKLQNTESWNRFRTQEAKTGLDLSPGKHSIVILIPRGERYGVCAIALLTLSEGNIH